VGHKCDSLLGIMCTITCYRALPTLSSTLQQKRPVRCATSVDISNRGVTRGRVGQLHPRAAAYRGAKLMSSYSAASQIQIKDSFSCIIWCCALHACTREDQSTDNFSSVKWEWSILCELPEVDSDKVVTHVIVHRCWRGYWISISTENFGLNDSINTSILSPDLSLC